MNRRIILVCTAIASLVCAVLIVCVALGLLEPDEDLPPNPERDDASLSAKPSAILGQGEIRPINWLPDNHTLAYQGFDGIYLYDVETQTKRRVIEIPNRGWEIGLSPDGSIVAVSVVEDKIPPEYFIELWRVSDGSFVCKIREDKAWNDIAFSPDGKLIASQSDLSENINLWQVSDCSFIHTIDNGTGRNWQIASIAFSPDGTLVASGSFDGAIKLWQLSDYALVRESRHPDQSRKVNSLAFTPDSTMLISSSDDSTISVWQVKDGSLISKFAGTYNIRSVGYDHDRNLLISGSQGHVWWIDDKGKVHLERIFDKGSGILSPDGKLFAIGIGPGDSSYYAFALQIWRTADWSLDSELRHMGIVNAFAFSPDGQLVAAASDDHSVWLWRVSDRTAVRELSGHTDFVNAVAFSPDGNVVASGCYDGMVRLWRVSDGGLVREFRAHLGPVSSVKFSPDGRLLASASHDVKQHSGEVDDKRSLASANHVDTIRVWQVSNGELVREIGERELGVGDIAFSPDGSLLAGAAFNSKDNAVPVWRVSDGTLVAMLKDTRFLFTRPFVGRRVAFSPDGNLVAGGNEIGTVLVWSLKDGNIVHEFQGYHGGVSGLSFNSDGKLLAIGSWYGRGGNPIRVQRLSDGASVFQLHNRGTTDSVVFSPDNTHLAVSNSNRIELWDVQP